MLRPSVAVVVVFFLGEQKSFNFRGREAWISVPFGLVEDSGKSKHHGSETGRGSSRRHENSARRHQGTKDGCEVGWGFTVLGDVPSRAITLPNTQISVVPQPAPTLFKTPTNLKARALPHQVGTDAGGDGGRGSLEGGGKNQGRVVFQLVEAGPNLSDKAHRRLKASVPVRSKCIHWPPAWFSFGAVLASG